MGILISNTNRSITLTKITGYVISSQSSTGSYRIPGKEAPSIDADSTVTSPTIYRITSDIGDGEKWVLELMRGERQLAFTMKDNESPTRNVKVDSIEFTADTTGKTGTSMDKWSVNIVLSGRDH